jgi:hypothetical protein
VRYLTRHACAWRGVRARQARKALTSSRPVSEVLRTSTGMLLHCHMRGRAVAALGVLREGVGGGIGPTLALMAAILARSRGEGGARGLDDSVRLGVVLRPSWRRDCTGCAGWGG